MANQRPKDSFSFLQYDQGKPSVVNRNTAPLFTPKPSSTPEKSGSGIVSILSNAFAVKSQQSTGSCIDGQRGLMTKDSNRKQEQLGIHKLYSMLC